MEIGFWIFWKICGVNIFLDFVENLWCVHFFADFLGDFFGDFLGFFWGNG